MSNKLINHNKDLKQLRDEGFEIEVRGAHLLVHSVPYINSNKEIKRGVLISTLSLDINQKTLRPETHVIHFMGEHPCNKDGSEIHAIKNATINQRLFDDIILNHAFSNKPQAGYSDYYEKVSRYCEIIEAPARSIDPGISSKTFKPIECKEEESVFLYMDTNSSRANLNYVNEKLKGRKIGIIGLGGTGSYILDVVAKTPVDEIRLFDGDKFSPHNAFRAPGAASLEILKNQPNKVDYFASEYSKMRRGIKAFPVYINEENIELLRDLTFIFICIDKNSARGIIMNQLKDWGIAFIDVGMGIELVGDTLTGILRATTCTLEKSDHLIHRISTEDRDDNIYDSNIQIADLNAFNALMAVMKWKRLYGFYKDLKEEHHSTFTINTSQLINEDFKENV